MDIVNIEALIAQGKIVKTANIDPTNDYVQIGKYIPNNRKKGGNPNTYESFVVPLSELLGGGSTTPIALGVIPQGTGPSITNGKWAFSGNDIYPLAPGAKIGTITNRVSTIYMSSTIDYVSDLEYVSGGNPMFTMTNDGRFYGNANTSVIPSNAGFQYNSLVANRANWRANAFGAHAAGAGNTYFKSRGVTIGALASVLDGDTIGHQTYIGVTGNNTNIPLAAVVSITVPVGGVFPTWVAADWNLELTNLAGTRNNVVKVTSEGNMGLSITSPTARLHVKGSDATSANYAARLEDISGGIIFNARNDRTVGINTLTNDPTSALTVFGDINIGNQILNNGGGANIFSSSQNKHGVVIYRSGTDDIYSAFAISDGGTFYYRVNKSGEMQINSQQNSFISPTPAVLGNLGIGTSAPTARLHIIGIDQSLGNQALKVQDSLGNNLLLITNNGRMLMPQLNVTNAGVFSGELYVDTAANILINGDLVVARKV